MARKKSPQTSDYKRLLAETGSVYENIRVMMLKAYWETGRRIVEYEQAGSSTARYGTNLIEHLSHDLTAKYGSGFSARNLRRMRSLYLEYKIWPTSAKLRWSHLSEFSAIRDRNLRTKLIKRAETHNLSARAVRELVRGKTSGARGRMHSSAAEKKDTKNGSRKRPHKNSHTVLSVERTALHIFRTIDPTHYKIPRGYTAIDLGFHIWRVVKKATAKTITTGTPSYLYPATVLSVIDGDTIWARVDCGLNTVIKEKLRLRGLDAPEITTPAGRAATRFVKKRLRPGMAIVIRTSTTDKYDRYLADILYLPGQARRRDPNRVLAHGTHLNQELLDAGHAVVW